MFLYVAIVRPFRRKLNNGISIVNEILILVTCGFHFFLLEDRSSEETKKTVNYFYAFPFLISYGLNFIVFLIFVARTLGKKCNEDIFSRHEIQPIVDEELAR